MKHKTLNLRESGMKTVKTTLLFLLTTLLLVSCTTVSKKAEQGEYKQVTEIAKSSGGVKQLSTPEHHEVCKSFIKLREFKNFFACHASLTQRLELKGAYRDYNSYAREDDNKIMITISLEGMLSEVYLALGQYDDVIEHASKAIKIYDDYKPQQTDGGYFILSLSRK